MILADGHCSKLAAGQGWLVGQRRRPMLPSCSLPRGDIGLPLLQRSVGLRSGLCVVRAAQGDTSKQDTQIAGWIQEALDVDIDSAAIRRRRQEVKAVIDLFGLESVLEAHDAYTKRLAFFQVVTGIFLAAFLVLLAIVFATDLGDVAVEILTKQGGLGAAVIVYGTLGPIVYWTYQGLGVVWTRGEMRIRFDAAHKRQGGVATRRELAAVVRSLRGSDVRLE